MNVYVKKISGEIAVSVVGTDAIDLMTSSIECVDPSQVVSAGMNASRGMLYVTTEKESIHYTGYLPDLLVAQYEALIIALIP